MKIHLIILILGAIMIIEGMPYFLFPNKLKKILLEISNLDIKILRILGLIFMSIGLVMIYIVRSKICQ